MKKKRIEQNEIKRYFLIIAAFLSFMILSLLFFLSWLQQDVEVSSRKTVATNVERQSYHLKSVLDIQFNYLTGMASYMGEGEDLFCQENKRLIQSIVKEQDLDLIGIMKADGDTYYNNGARKNVKNRGYFKKVMQGQKIMSPPIESKVDGRTKVILVVPIYRNGKVTGALGALVCIPSSRQLKKYKIFVLPGWISGNIFMPPIVAFHEIPLVLRLQVLSVAGRLYSNLYIL